MGSDIEPRSIDNPYDEIVSAFERGYLTPSIVSNDTGSSLKRDPLSVLLYMSSSFLGRHDGRNPSDWARKWSLSLLEELLITDSVGRHKVMMMNSARLMIVKRESREEELHELFTDSKARETTRQEEQDVITCTT
jgi:hypothetical protein